MASILVIDDDGTVRQAIRLMLEQQGHRIQTASEGGTGMMCLAASKVDLVITDMLMPGQEGIETIRDLRRRSRDLPILAMSGGGCTGFHEVLAAARLFGANATLAVSGSIRAALSKQNSGS